MNRALNRALTCFLHCLLLGAVLAGCASSPAHIPAPPLPESARANSDDYLLILVRNIPPRLATRAGSTGRGYDGTAAYGVSSDARATARALAADYGLEEVSAWPISALRAHCVMYRVPSGETRDALLLRLAADKRVALAQPLQSFSTSALIDAAHYDDPYFDLQRGFAQMSVAAAHQWSQGDGVSVAVIDTGVDVAHPDLAGRTRVERDFVADGASSAHAERHGTAIAGLIAAVGNNGQGIVGVAPRVDLLVLRACWPTGADGAAGACNSFTLAQALSAAIDARADVINLSLVGPADPLLAALIERASAAGAIVVGSVPAGGRIGGFPSEVPQVLAVAMVEENAPSRAALLAPGRDVLTLAPHGRYDFASGSSLATASVSGIVALLRARRPALQSAEVHRLLAESMQWRVAATHEPVSIDACSALSVLLTLDGCPPRADTGAANLPRTVGEHRSARQKNP